MWQDLGMANWKLGAAVMCTNDYHQNDENNFKQGMKGVIVDEYNTMFTWRFTISFRDGAGKVTIPGDDMDKHCALI